MASRPDGFTLVEVLISILVLTTVLSGVASLTVVAARARSRAMQQTMVTLIGVREVESLRAGMIASAGIEYFDANGRSLGPVLAAGAVFMARWQSTPASEDAATVLVRVRASVVGGGAAAPLVPSGAPNVLWIVATTRGGS